MYKPEDVEVFIFAHDRADFLRETIECYLNQSLTGARIVVLANAPTPEVLELVQAYALQGVELIYTTELLGLNGSIRWCQQLASRAITVMAHDDDLIHPAYLETLLRAYNRFPDLNIALSAMGNWIEETRIPLNRAVILPSATAFSAYIFLGHSFTFSSCSYKTARLKEMPSPQFDVYGKVQDVPFMLSAVTNTNATACVLQYPFILYRIHDGQDCQTYATGPTAQQWISLDLLHKELMSRGIIKIRLAYIFNAYHRLRIGWKDWCRCEHGKISFREYIQFSCHMGACGPIREFFGLLLRGELRKFILSLLCPFPTINIE